MNMSTRSSTNSLAARQEQLTCKVCTRTFHRHEHLQRHARTHTKEKPYTCPCGKSFSRKDLLTRHERLSHSAGIPSASQQAEPDGTHIARAPPTANQHGQLEAGLPPSSVIGPLDRTVDAPFTDPMLLSLTDDLLAGYDDPIFEFSRFMNAGELNTDWDSMALSSHPAAHIHDTTAQQVTPESTDLSSRVPDDLSGDDDFQELKPLSCPWLMREPQRAQLSNFLSPYHHVIPDFVLPTRLALARYISGYVDGFSNHHPFIHVPTLNLLSYHQSPELVLALLAIGAQYRYETKTASSLYRAGRSIILERLRRGDLFPRTEGPEQQMSVDEYMDRARALLLLATYSSWQSNVNLTQECFEYQSLIARFLRQVGLSEVSGHDEQDWIQWVRVETNRRTMFFGWCLLNLQSFAYDSPPLLLGRELNLCLPSSCQEWVARNQSEWNAARAHYSSPVMFKEAHESHLQGDDVILPATGVSPMGNYILIHAILQRIYFTQQLSRDTHRQSLSPHNVAELEHALNRWRHTWCTSPESLLDLQNSYASLSFTSTALLGAAHIRLHCNLGQWRDLQSCDPKTVAATLQEAPMPQRGANLIYALLHSVHTLNIPVQLGISYLSRCQSFSWSIHHALCDLECAAFLSKWLHVVAVSHENEPLSALEVRVLKWIVRVVREALLSQDETIYLSDAINDSDLTNATRTAHRLSYAVVKVWAQMFKSCNSPWPVVGFIGQSLDRYAELVHTNW